MWVGTIKRDMNFMKTRLDFQTEVGRKSGEGWDGLLELVEKTIDKIFCSPSRPNRRHAYDQRRIECEQKGYPSKAYLRKALQKARSQHT